MEKKLLQNIFQNRKCVWLCNNSIFLKWCRKIFLPCWGSIPLSLGNTSPLGTGIDISATHDLLWWIFWKDYHANISVQSLFPPHRRTYPDGNPQEKPWAILSPWLPSARYCSDPSKVYSTPYSGSESLITCMISYVHTYCVHLKYSKNSICIWELKRYLPSFDKKANFRYGILCV